MKPTLVPLLGILFTGCGLFLLWRGSSRQGWVTLNGTVITHSPDTGMITLNLEDENGPRFSSVEWPHRSRPLPGMRLRLTHPPGQPTEIRMHHNHIVDIAGGLGSIACGIAALALGR